MARHFRDRLALTYAFWSLVLIGATGALAAKFGWLPLDSAKPEASAESAEPEAPRKFARKSPASPASDAPAREADPLPEWGESEQAEPGTNDRSAARMAQEPSSPAAGRAEAFPDPDLQWDPDAQPSRPIASARIPERPANEIASGLAGSERSPAPFRRKGNADIDYSTVPIEPPEGAAESSGNLVVIRPDRSARRPAGDDVENDPEAEIAPPPRRPSRASAEPADDASAGRPRGSVGFTPVQSELGRGRRQGILQVGGETDPEAVPKPAGAVLADERLREVARLVESGDRLAAHKEMSRLYWKHAELAPQLQETIDENARLIYFASQPHYMEPYVVEPGDQLSKVAKKYSVSWEYLATLNRIDPKKIRAGQRLKVIKGPFAALVDLSDFALVIHCHGYYVRRYPIGIGRDDSTPTGKFSVKNKLVNPTYYGPNGNVIDADDPSNPLGERWIDLGDSYGIHGTIDPHSIGKAESKGCLRLKNADVEEVFNLLTEGSEVIIRK